MTEKTEASASRRDFLKLAGTAAPAAVAAVAVSGTQA
ncbi:MAG: twin-arginine translocation signal domain-containing protein, partial [Rhodobacteraceae bacterium]|nr:twin-arginine translocation signal domain-containing protein [Paracoccaceae bacterium]